jgi:hypothetical protein
LLTFCRQEADGAVGTPFANSTYIVGDKGGVCGCQSEEGPAAFREADPFDR